MKDPADLLASLLARGVKVRVDSGTLRVVAPKSALLAAELEEIRNRKSELIEILQTDLAEEFPIVPRDAGCVIPLTAPQRRIFAASFGNQRLSIRDCGIASRISGPLDVAQLQASIDEAMHRHESLRTRFVAVEGGFRQQVDAECSFRMELVDLTGLSTSRVEQEVSRLADELIESLVDLSVGPMLIGRLCKISSQEHVLILALDHMVMDRISMQILNRDVWTLYHEGRTGDTTSLPALPVQFADYAVWQEKTHAAWAARHAQYWISHLTGAPPFLLPTDCDSPIEQTPAAAAAREFPLGQKLSAAIRELARQERVHPAVVLLAVYGTVMSRWRNQSDMVVIFVSHGRFSAELENMIGYIAHHPRLRLELRPADCPIDLIRRVGVEYASALHRRDFDRVRDLVPGLVTDLYFNWRSSESWRVAPHARMAAEDEIRIQSYPFRKPDVFKLGCYFLDTDAGIACRVEYLGHVMHDATIRRFGGNILSTAERFVTHRSARLAW